MEGARLWSQTSPASLLGVLIPRALYKAWGQTSSTSPLEKRLIKLCRVPGRSVGDVPASQPSPTACTGAGALRCSPGQGGLLCWMCAYSWRSWGGTVPDAPGQTP